MKKEWTCRDTQHACYLGYIAQAIIVNLPALLFVTFRTRYGVTLSQLSFMILMIFVVQILVDFFSAPVVDKIGYRPCTIFGFFLCSLGLVLLGILPVIMEDTYGALMIALAVASVGSGLMEVLISPVTEALPLKNKEKVMSFLHSFYCWGVVGVVLLSTLYFSLAGIENWMYLPILWAVLPLIGLFMFFKVPVYPLMEAGASMSMIKLLKTPMFWLLFLLMVCSGASEQGVSQWASMFAEKGLNISKTAGDMMGMCMFAFLMGTSRLLFGTYINWTVDKSLKICGIMCIGCYLMIIFSSSPMISLLGCALCGFSVGIMWPGVFSLASVSLPKGGTAMFALLAMGGDVGCSVGPALVGWVTEAVSKSEKMVSWLGSSGGMMRFGFLIAIIFPVLLVFCVMIRWNHKRQAADI